MERPEVSRHDIPATLKATIVAALEHGVIDALDLVAMAATHGNDFVAIEDYIFHCGFANRHHAKGAEAHSAVCKARDEAYAEEHKAS